MLNSKVIVFSDACPNGWGAAYEIHSTERHWSNEESLLHINMLEMRSALFAKHIYAKYFFNCTVHLNVDNTSTLSRINKQTAPNCKNFLGFLYSEKYLSQNLLYLIQAQ